MKYIIHSAEPCSRLTSVFWILVFCIVFLGAGCSGKGETNRNRAGSSPTLLVAVDGLEWSVLEPLLAEGKLPVFSDLIERGSSGYLKTMTPAFSPVIWTSIATGKVPQKHGIPNFIYEVSRNGKPEYRSFTSGHRKTKAFWNILSDYGFAVHCLGWWITYPTEPITGVMVSQTNTTDALRNPKGALWKGSLLKGVDGQVHPSELQNMVMGWLEEVDASLEKITEEMFGPRPHPLTLFGRRMWEQSQWAFRADAIYLRAAREILSSERPTDLLAVYIGGPDVVSHRFWRYTYPGEFTHPPSPEEIENFGRIIENYYLYVDRKIGELLELLPEDAGVMIVSDHGMHAANTDHIFSADDPPELANSAKHHDGPPGVIVAAGGGFRRAGRQDRAGLKTLGSVFDVTPTLLALKGVPLGLDMDGKPMLELIHTGDTEIPGIHTHDTPEWLAGRQERILEAVDQSERIEQLRALGYLQ